MFRHRSLRGPRLSVSISKPNNSGQLVWICAALDDPRQHAKTVHIKHLFCGWSVGDHDHRCFSRSRIGSEQSENRCAIQLRHLHVEQNKIWPLRQAELYRLRAVMGDQNGPSRVFKPQSVHVRDGVIIIGNQYPRSGVQAQVIPSDRTLFNPGEAAAMSRQHSG